MVMGKVVTHLCLTLITKELKFSAEHSRVVKHYIYSDTKYHILCTVLLLHFT